MNSSGIKRGLAATAISALAVTGLPFLATSASAIPIADQVDNTIGNDDIVFYAPLADVSDKNDGTNTTISLVTGGGSLVTSVQYQYQDSAAADPLAWNDVPGGIVARNADGVFAFDWAGSPATVTDIRAVANTGDTVVSGAAKLAPAAANTVELDTEGSLGVFQEPYTDGGTYDGTTSELLAVTGTVSEGTAGVTVTDASHGTGASDAGTIEPESSPASPASDTWNAVVDIDGYPYSGGTEPNQIALNAATTTNSTDDAEGSTLYVQTIGSIEVTPATQEDVTPGDATVDIQVLDTQGQPVAGAEVFSDTDLDTDGAGPDTDTDGPGALVGYTDGRGQINDSVVGGAQTETYWVNTTDTDAYQPGTDPSDTATVTTYTPVLTSVDIVNNQGRSNFDIDELSDGDDFTIVTQDQRGNTYEENIAGANNDVEYRWIIDPSGPGATYTSPWTGAETVNGEYDVPALTDTSYNGGPVPEGTYTLEARRPNVGGTGLTNAAPETFTASESDITFEEGDSVRAPIEGETSVTGTLANDDGALAGREVTLNYVPGVDSRIAPEAEQPAGVDVTGNTAVVTTDANGQFTIKLEDPAGPVVIDDVPETGDLNALATGETATDGTDLQGNLGPDDGTGTDGDFHGDADDSNDGRDAEADLMVNWAATPEIVAIDVDTDVLDDYSYWQNGAAPGSPVDLDITVFTEDDGNTTDPDSDPDPVSDFPVTVEVNKGFLSPNAEDEDDLQLDESDDSGLWGFFENLGQSQEVSTGDSLEAGIVAAIEDDADFDDNGLTEMTITVTAGDVTEEVDVQFDSRNFLNMVDGDLVPADGEPSGEVPTNEDVDFDLFAEDQYGNLIGEHLAQISDDSTVADFTTDGLFGQTQTDFITSGSGITAFSDAPTTQTLMAMLNSQEVLVDDADLDDSPEQSNTTMSIESDPIEWVEPTVEKINAGLTVRGNDNGAADDNVFANAHRKTEGGTVILFRKQNGKWKKIDESTMNSKGNHKFKNINDKNGNKRTKYKVVVKATELTRKGVGKNRLR